MFATRPSLRKAARRLFAAGALSLLSACGIALPGIGGGEDGGPTIDPSAPVPVALLVPRGSDRASDIQIAADLEAAARLAIADLQGAQIDLRVYPTAGVGARAAESAAQAVADGAKVILGPLYGGAANAAGVAVAETGINLLAFSNNPTIAGGNVFVLGPTFANTADRLVAYGRARGIDRYMVVHADDLQGQIGRQAIAGAVERRGGTLTGAQSYALTEEAIAAAAPAIAAAARDAGTQAVFMTGGVNADLPLLATLLPEAGLAPSSTQFMGLTRWNAASQAMALPGLQGGLFALPDQDRQAAFEARFSAATGRDPHPLSGLAYDGIAAIGALVAQGDRNALRRSSLTTRAGFQGTQGIFRLLDDGTNQRALAVARVQDGRAVIVDPAPSSFGGGGF
ncbi:MAG: penicillin-binding protein activator [Paracoccaceae bacterium]